ncbi:MAG: hypothetical protein K2G97_01065 [Oscillospiraceae bacterium]|nr:hypothetical protein [Oscillospiraceae bacterium]
MKKGLIMGFVAIIAAFAGLVITIITLIKKGKCNLNRDLDYDDADYIDDDFDDYDNSISDDIIDKDDEDWSSDAYDENDDNKSRK